MKKLRFTSIVLAILMLFTGTASAALAEEAEITAPESIVVANSTKVNGMFFTRQFGNNTSDLDVREMLHGYSPIAWVTQLSYIVDNHVVKNMEKVDAKNGTEYVFTLQEDLKWNDGSPITAKDYVFGYALQMSKAFGEIGGDTDIFQYIVGYENYANGKAKELVGVRLLDDYQFSVTVKKEYLPYFYEYSYLYNTPSPISVIAPGCEVRDDGKGVYIADKDEKTRDIFTAELLQKTILDPATGYLTHPMLTCGPYSLVSYEPKTGTVKFTENEYFKGNYEGKKPAVKEVTLLHVLPEDMPEKLKDGTVDIINKAVNVDCIDACKKVAEEKELSTRDYSRLGYAFIGLACEQGPQQFQAVRQAIAYAFDTDDFVKQYTGDYGVPVYGYYGSGQWMAQAAMGALAVQGLSEEQLAKWSILTLDKLNHYDMDTAKSLELLEKDGWTLNENGKPFDAEQDTLRYKKVKGKLMPLSFTFGLTKDNKAAADILKRLQDTLIPMGAEINVVEDSFNNILLDYLNESEERKYDMSFLAYNFNSIFDPLVEMTADKKLAGSQNASRLYDKEIVDLCWKLHKTESAEILAFLERWVAFQERYNEILPSIPLYSNMYFDFYPATLQNYHPDTEANWPRALLGGYFGEATDEGSPLADMLQGFFNSQDN